MGRVEPFTVYLLFLVLHPPEEVPSTEQWFTKRFSRKISNEVHISPYFQEILLPHTLMRKPSILRKMPTEVTTIQNLCQQQPPTLLIPRRSHPTQLARPLWSVILIVQRFQAPEGGYILSSLRKERLGEKGGAFFNGKKRCQ